MVGNGRRRKSHEVTWADLILLFVDLGDSTAREDIKPFFLPLV
jgi:hypothetical protein